MDENKPNIKALKLPIMRMLLLKISEKEDMLFSIAVFLTAFFVTVLPFFIYFMICQPITAKDEGLYNRVSIVQMITPEQLETRRAIWLVQSVATALKMNFVDYSSQIENNRSSFTDNGFLEFVAMSKAIKDNVISNKYILNSVPTSNPVFVNEEKSKEGDSFYDYQVPMLLTYTSPSIFLNENIIVDVTVKEVAPALWKINSIKIVNKI